MKLLHREHIGGRGSWCECVGAKDRTSSQSAKTLRTRCLPVLFHPCSIVHPLTHLPTCILCSLLGTLLSVLCTLYTVFCTLCSVRALCSVEYSGTLRFASKYAWSHFVVFSTIFLTKSVLPGTTCIKGTTHQHWHTSHHIVHIDHRVKTNTNGSWLHTEPRRSRELGLWDD